MLLRVRVQLIRVRILQRVLKLGAADPVFNGQILHWLHEERNSRNFGKLRLQTADHIARANLAFGEWLQIDENSTAVQCRVGSVDTDKRRKALNRRILQNDLRPAPVAGCAMSENETDCGASETPWITPVS